MKLASRDRAKVNAGLLLIHDEGLDPDEVTRLAQASMNTGTPPLQAYERAFEGFMTSRPQFRPALMRIGQLMDASDDRTIAGYNVALERYAETGDNAALEPITATVQQDLAELATRTGDAGFVDGWGIVADSAAPAPAPTPPAGAETLTTGGERPGWGPMGYSAAGRDTGEA